MLVILSLYLNVLKTLINPGKPELAREKGGFNDELSSSMSIKP
jgi:hypothetical protein